MKFINKLEKKFGKYAVNNLIIYILLAYGIGYILEMFNPEFYSYLTLSPALIFKGQVWRIFTWICTVPEQFSLFIVFMFMFYYFIGQSLERYLGTFRYNLFMFSGWFFMTVGALAIYGISYLATGSGISLSMSTYYLNLTSFLAFALIFPNTEVYFMMILPIKIKWLAVADGIYLLYEFLHTLSYLKYSSLELYVASGGTMTREGIYAIATSIILSVLNFILFYFTTRNAKRFSPNEVYRKKKFRKNVKMGQQSDNITRHKCAVCGRTEKDGDGLVFRFCSKCQGNYEYCQDHLFTHEHVIVENNNENR